VFLVVAELGARSFYATAFNPLQSDPVLNHIWIPNLSRTVGTFADRGIPPFTRTVNGQSWMMDYEVAPQKSDGTYRIAYLGDSFIEGTCPAEDTVPSIVGSSLTVPGYERVEVINTGTSSYAPTLYYLLLKTKLLQFHPDLIVVNIDMTDVFDDSLYRATLVRGENGEPIACPAGHPLLSTHRRTERGLEQLSTFERGAAWLAERSSLARMILHVASQVKRDARSGDEGIPQAFAWCGTNRSQDTQSDVQWSMDMLRRLIQLAKSNGIKIVVTAIPHREQLEGKWSLQPMNDIEAVCKAEGVPFLNPVEAFKQRLGSTPPQEIYIPEDMHFNPKGYRMWGEIQREFLNSLGLP
jgi:lysophospholipase L1-like esterase